MCEVHDNYRVVHLRPHAVIILNYNAYIPYAPIHRLPFPRCFSNKIPIVPAIWPAVRFLGLLRFSCTIKKKKERTN